MCVLFAFLSQISGNTESAILLAGSECYCEDTFLVDNSQCAVSCLDGDDLVTLKHCELRSSTGALFDVRATTESDGDGGAPQSSIYTLNCITDAGSETELRRYAWCGRSAKAKPSVQKGGGDSATLDELVVDDMVAGSRKRARDE
jgi:hypothetical protein